MLAAVAARAAHAAALLDGELAPEVADDARAAGVDLLPGPGEVGPRCSCPDWADPCKHSAAVCYLVADALDADPFTLLLVRGRSREEVLAGLRRARTAEVPAAIGDGDDEGEGDGGDPGVEARLAYARGAAATPELPGVPPPPRRPGRPAVLAVDPPAASGLRRDDLVELAADAARRAWELCTGEATGAWPFPPRPTWRVGPPPASATRSSRSWSPALGCALATSSGWPWPGRPAAPREWRSSARPTPFPGRRWRRPVPPSGSLGR